MPDNQPTPEKTQKRVASERKARADIERKAKKLEKLTVEYVPIDDVKPNEYNPNRQADHDFELLCRSIEEDGFTQPIITTQELTIVDGEHRWRAARTLGYKEIPVVRNAMTEEQARISTLRHNKARGEHQIELEAQVIKELQMLGATDWMKDSLLMEDDEIHKMLAEIPEIDVPDYTKPDPDKNPDVHETRKAVEKRRQYEEQMKQAKNEEDRKAIQRDTRFYRLNLIFEGDEGKKVQAFVGNNPSERILEAAKKELEELENA